MERLSFARIYVRRLQSVDLIRVYGSKAADKELADARWIEYGKCRKQLMEHHVVIDTEYIGGWIDHLLLLLTWHGRQQWRAGNWLAILVPDRALNTARVSLLTRKLWPEWHSSTVHIQVLLSCMRKLEMPSWKQAVKIPNNPYVTPDFWDRDTRWYSGGSRRVSGFHDEQRMLIIIWKSTPALQKISDMIFSARFEDEDMPGW